MNKGQKSYFEVGNTNVFIIGNGFDLDLGLRTSYFDFYKYEFNVVPELTNTHKETIETIEKNTSGKNSLLFHVLKAYYGIKEWMSLEEVLLIYFLIKSSIIQSKTVKDIAPSSNINDEDVEKMKQLIYEVAKKLNIDNVVSEVVDNDDKIYFNMLKEDLKIYLKYATNLSKDLNSVAANTFRYICHNGNFTFINFNYTTLDYIWRLKVNEATNVRFKGYLGVHGTLAGDIILGINENEPIEERYDYVRKHTSKNAQALNTVLQSANEVVFFGHSFGLADYHYFKDFFEKHAMVDSAKDNEAHITCFTYDEKGKLGIQSSIKQSLGEDGYENLQKYNDFRIICTKNIYDYTQTLERLSREGDDLNWEFNQVSNRVLGKMVTKIYRNIMILKSYAQRIFMTIRKP